MDRRYRIRIHCNEIQERPAIETVIPLVLELDPPDAGETNVFEVRIGRSIAQTRLIVRRFFDSDGKTDLGFMASGHLRAIAQLWHALYVAHGGEIPVSFLALGDERLADEPMIEGFVTSADLEEVLREVEQKCNLGVRTESLNPPIYLDAFWGPRQFGMLDASIARLDHSNVVPDTLLDKARRVEAPHNWAVVYPQDLPDCDEVLSALKPLIKHRNGSTFELSSGQDPAVPVRFFR